MKLINGFVIKTVGGKCVAVATAEAAARFKGMIVLNETAEFIFSQLIKKDTTEEEIARELAENFDITEEKAAADVSAFIQKLDPLNILQ